MGELLKEGAVRIYEKPGNGSDAYIPEPDPHDLCLMESGEISSPFACDETVRPHGVTGTGLPALVIGG